MSSSSSPTSKEAIPSHNEVPLPDKEVNDTTSRAATADALPSKEADVALEYLVNRDEKITYSPEEERRLRWKIDLILLPLLGMSFALSYIDKVTISYAALYNMREDLNLHNQQYSWANSIFFFGYLAGQIPANYLLQRLPLGKFLSTNLLLWGIMVMLCATAQNFAGLATIRFFLGIFEASVFPCLTHITGMFYKRVEQAARICIWISFQGIALVIGGIVAYGIGKADSSIASWRVIFLVFGGFTFLWALVIFALLPDLPITAKFLNPRERAVAVERLRENRTGVKCFKFKFSQAIEAFTDPQVWLLCAWSGIGNITNVGASFLPIIISQLGFTGLDTTLYTMPTGGFLFVCIIAGGIGLSFMKNYRTVMAFVLTFPTLAGMIMLQVLPDDKKWARLGGAWLLLCIVATYAVLLSLVTSNIAGFSKKVTTTAMMYIFYCVGNIVSPHLFLDEEEKTGYGTAIRAMLTATALCEAVVFSLGAYYIWENRRRDRKLAATPPESLAAMSVEDEEFLDRTDREDELKFRYRW